MIGTTVSHYKILEKLGGGGMGVVYKAQDTKLKRTAALKFLPPDLTRDEEAKERFMHEAQAASALDHPNICTIYEIGETDDGQMFIAMACYEGETLEDKIDRGPMKVDEAVDISAQIAQGLQKAHEKGIIHRDIKPANILITTDGVAKIVDFGLAKLTGATKLTKTGSTVGTAAYMSPEQVRSEEVDCRADIWSLGVVLYEMISKQLPFRGEHEAAMLYSITNEELKPITSICGDVPAEIARVIEKCLQKDSSLRYAKAEDLLADLRAVTGAATHGQLRSPFSSSPNRRRFSKPLIAGIIAIVLLVAVVAIVRYWLKSPYPDLKVETLQVRQVTTNGKVRSAALSPDARYIAYIFQEAGKTGVSLQDLTTGAVVQIVPPERGNHWGLQFYATGDHLFFVGEPRSIYRIATLGGTSERFFSKIFSGYAFFSLSPREQRVCYFVFDTTHPKPVLFVDSVKSATQGTAIVAAYGDFQGTVPAWRSDEKELACVVRRDSGASVVLLNLEDLSQSIVPSPLWKTISSIVWHPNGEDLLVAGTPKGRTGSLWLCSCSSGELTLLSSDPSVGKALSIARDGTTISLVKSAHRTSLWIVPEGDMARAQKLPINAEGSEGGLAWFSKDVLVFPAQEGSQSRLGFFNIRSGLLEYKSVGKANEQSKVMSLTVSSSGQVYFSTVKEGGGTIGKYDRSADAVETLAEGYFSEPTISSNERTLVFTSNVSGYRHVTKMTLPGGSPQQMVSEISGCPTFSTDGRMLAFYALELVERNKIPYLKYVLRTAEDATGRQRNITDRLQGIEQYSRLAFTQDGQGIIYNGRDMVVGHDPSTSVLWLQPLDGKPAWPLLRFPYSEIYQFAVAPDGKTIALIEGSTYSDVVVLTAR